MSFRKAELEAMCDHYEPRVQLQKDKLINALCKVEVADQFVRDCRAAATSGDEKSIEACMQALESQAPEVCAEVLANLYQRFQLN